MLLGPRNLLSRARSKEETAQLPWLKTPSNKFQIQFQIRFQIHRNLTNNHDHRQVGGSDRDQRLISG